MGTRYSVLGARCSVSQNHPAPSTQKHKTMYINCHSYYSLRYGTMSIGQLVQKASEYKADVVALTDINNSTGMPEFVAECNKNDISPVAGIEFRNDNDLLFIGLARNNNGIRELNEFLTRYNVAGMNIEFPPPRFTDAYAVYSLGRLPERKLYENERIGIKPAEANRLLTILRTTGNDKNGHPQPRQFQQSGRYFHS